MKKNVFFPVIMLMYLANTGFGQTTLGSIIPNTNNALPSAYNFQEYVFPEPNDQGICTGETNTTASIQEVFLAQTHRQTIGHPLFFTIGHRPALLQVAVTGTGVAPDIKVEGRINGQSQGELCLKGPTTLSTTIDLETPNFDDFFSVTLPKSWVINGLELIIKTGTTSRTITPEELKIGPYTEMNLVEMSMDVIDYNNLPPQNQIFNDFLPEMASAIPASVVRHGTFPANIPFPEFAIANNTEQIIRISSTEDEFDPGIANAAANRYLISIQQACRDYSSTVYFGNTLNLNPGGWGGDRSFVAADYGDVFIHELGHALSLPHWGEFYNIPIENDYQYLYPYGGETNDGSGIGETWSFIQAKYAFVNPKCEVEETGNTGKERSDAMERGSYCPEMRGDAQGPWDGFGIFSAYSMHHAFVGGTVKQGQVPYKGGMEDYQIPNQDGFPTVSLENGNLVFKRDPTQPQDSGPEDWFLLPGAEQLEQEMYLLYGSMHPNQNQANIIYEPVKMTGTLMPTIDPTDPQMFSTLQSLDPGQGRALQENPRDITLKLTYIDGSQKHVIVPYHNFDRVPNDDYGLWRTDIVYFAVTVPGDVDLCQVEMYQRPFFIGFDDEDVPGNINYAPYNITAENFMDDAVLKATVDFSCNCPGTPGYIAPGTPCDDGNPYTINDVEDGFCNCEGELVDIAPCGLIFNGQFEVNLDGWWTWGSDASSTNAEAVFENIELFDAGIAQGPFNFNTGEQLTINFEAYAAQPRTIEVAVYLDEEPWTEYFRETINLSTNKQIYELSFNFSENSITNGAMLFDLKGEEASVFLDNVCMEVGACEQGTTILEPIIDKVYQHETAINFDGTIATGRNVTFQAGNTITLSPGFIAENGAMFHARIADCTPSNTITPSAKPLHHLSFNPPAKVLEKLGTKHTQQTHCCAAHAPNAHCGSYVPKKLGTTPNYSHSSPDNSSQPSLSKVLNPSAPIASFAQIQVMPNPLSQAGKIRLQVNEPTEGILNLLDLNGRVIINLYNGPIMEGWSEFSIQPSNLPSGLYLVAFTGSKEQQVQKIIIK